MKRMIFTSCLKIGLVLSVLWGIIFYALVVPYKINDFIYLFPEYEYLRQPGIIAVGLTSLPICVAVVSFWIIFSNISKENSFCVENARLLLLIGACAAVDTIYVFAGFMFLCVVHAVNLSVILLSAGVMIFGLAIMSVAFLLSHLTDKACAMKDEIDFTV